MTAKLIGIDWGSTNFRAYLIGDDAQILDKKSSGCGMLSLAPNAFGDALRREVGDWLATHTTIPIVMAGMVGARKGWKEAEYLHCPVSLDQLTDSLTRVDFDPSHPTYIIPGLAMMKQDMPDVLRGEETQLLGAVSTSGQYEVFCLPGTHSKWVSVKNNTVQEFRTFMTGELFSLLETKSILAKQMHNQIDDEDAFFQGVNKAKRYQGLLSELFQVRAAMLLGQRQESSSRSYLSGLLMGYEIMSSRQFWESVEEVPIKVIAADAMTSWYLKALSGFGCSTAIAIDPEQAVVDGLVKVAQHIQAKTY